MIKPYHMLKQIWAVLVTVGLLAGCKKAKCGYDECAVKAPDSEVQAVQSYLASQNITNALQHCSGLFYVIDTLGTGQYPNACAGVTVRYVGRLMNGNIFDHGTATFSLREVITGWRNGIPLVRAGGKIRLYVPPSLGYGSAAVGLVPANSMLVFEVGLDAVALEE
jgi:FKBP-type peptidyl-prolyl cis-trans isomerase FkpA